MFEEKGAPVIQNSMHPMNYYLVNIYLLYLSSIFCELFILCEPVFVITFL